MAEVVHGTTLVTNAVIERRGAVTGMLVTTGFGDIMDMGFERRYDLFDLRINYPPPLVPRRLRIEVDERVRFDGSVERALDEARCRCGGKAVSRDWTSRPWRSAFCTPMPIRRTSAGRADPAASSARTSRFGLVGVFPNMREFERWTTTTVNAFTQPMFDRYVKRLEMGLRRKGSVAISTSWHRAAAR